jgi:hypothetical protein
MLAPAEKAYAIPSMETYASIYSSSECRVLRGLSHADTVVVMDTVRHAHMAIWTVSP